MHNVVVEKRYQFVAPISSVLWPKMFQRLARRWLRRKFGVNDVECKGLEHLARSHQAGHGILMAPNHCRPADPFVVLETARQAGVVPYTMASAHLFMAGRMQAFMLRRAGVFSVYREGVDRQAIAAAGEILTEGNRPLVIFPEGVITRSNERLAALMEGTAFIARTAAKKRAQATPPSEVVVHPIAMKYFFRGDIRSALEPTLDELETRLSWRSQRDLPLVDRIVKIGLGLLALKEIEYMGAPQEGTIDERAHRLVDHLLAPSEKEWLNGKTASTVVARVKALRAAVLPAMITGEITDDERQRRWRQLADMYFAQQLSFYPPDYVRSQPSPERFLETVERFEEDLTDECRIYRPMTVTVQVGEAIPVSPARDRGAAEDPVMAAIERQLRESIAGLSTGRAV